MQPTENKSVISLKRLLLILVILVLLLAGYWAIQSLRFRLVSTSPNLSDVADIAPYIDLNFNKSLSSGYVVVRITPNAMKSFTVNGKTLRVNLSSTMDNIKYSITVNGLRSVSGQLFSRTLTFVPHNIPFNKLPKDEQQAIISSQDPNDPSLVTNNPLLAHLPYGGIGWRMLGRIGSVNGKSTLTIEVTISFSDADYKSSVSQQQTLIQQREQEAQNYIKSLGLSPSNYNIQYIIPPT